MQPTAVKQTSQAFFKGLATPRAPNLLYSTFDTITCPAGGVELGTRCSPGEFKRNVVSHELAEGALAVIFVRHGRSYGNEREAVLKDAKAGQLYAEIPNHQLPLTDRGINQAHSAGRYIADMIRAGLIPPIDRVICSPFTRTQETLDHLIKGAQGYCAERQRSLVDVFENGDRTRVDQWNWVRERDWADFEKLSPEEQEREYRRREKNPYYWTPTGSSSGETIADVSNRASVFMQAMHRPEFRGKVVLVVTHGEFMNAIELVMRRLDPFSSEFNNSFKRGIPNCGIMMIARTGFELSMAPPLENLGGFSHELRAVPYYLPQKQNEKFEDWNLGIPQWNEIRKETRARVGEFTPRQLPDDVTQFVSGARDAGIGKGKVKPKV